MWLRIVPETTGDRVAGRALDDPTVVPETIRRAIGGSKERRYVGSVTTQDSLPALQNSSSKMR